MIKKTKKLIHKFKFKEKCALHRKTVLQSRAQSYLNGRRHYLTLFKT